jgi:hypothetical protein
MFYSRVTRRSNIMSENNERAMRRRRRLVTTLVMVLDVVGLAAMVIVLGVQAYGYRLRGALRVAPFKTTSGSFETSAPANPAFDPQATLNGDNRMITVFGFYACLPSEGEAVVHAIVSQETTGAFARGSFSGGKCTGQIEHFTIRAMVPEDAPAFQEGRVKIEALGANRTGTNQFSFNDLVFWGRFAIASKSSDEGPSTVNRR